MSSYITLHILFLARHASCQTDSVQIYPCDVEVLCVEPRYRVLILKLAHLSIFVSYHSYGRQPKYENRNPTGC